MSVEKAYQIAHDDMLEEFGRMRARVSVLENLLNRLTMCESVEDVRGQIVQLGLGEENSEQMNRRMKFVISTTGRSCSSFGAVLLPLFSEIYWWNPPSWSVAETSVLIECVVLLLPHEITALVNFIKVLERWFDIDLCIDVLEMDD